MSDAIGPPRRKRLSWESRCEIVAKVRLHGMSPAQAAACSGVHPAGAVTTTVWKPVTPRAGRRGCGESSWEPAGMAFACAGILAQAMPPRPAGASKRGGARVLQGGRGRR